MLSLFYKLQNTVIKWMSNWPVHEDSHAEWTRASALYRIIYRCCLTEHQWDSCVPWDVIMWPLPVNALFQFLRKTLCFISLQMHLSKFPSEFYRTCSQLKKRRKAQPFIFQDQDLLFFNALQGRYVGGPITNMGKARDQLTETKIDG